VLSQLSYSPVKALMAKMVGLGRVELPTSPLSGVRSNQLSYRPALRAPPPNAAGGSPKSHSVLRPMVAARLARRTQTQMGFEDKG
jgi:hypothetical protein